ncbi:hypothetical protein MA16_Dca017040 [Dendrobium catenatum]|uniref:Uncharacterized protein n=1 Tax=Dendrobium catenatum TaxID=906689 RepID=A0A2I0V9H1_9ASPA|nr:hypothetical protein MA16_Dca017040 [Dendrobium catenatum]
MVEILNVCCVTIFLIGSLITSESYWREASFILSSSIHPATSKKLLRMIVKKAVRV